MCDCARPGLPRSRGDVASGGGTCQDRSAFRKRRFVFDIRVLALVLTQPHTSDGFGPAPSCNLRTGLSGYRDGATPCVFRGGCFVVALRSPASAGGQRSAIGTPRTARPAGALGARAFSAASHACCRRLRRAGGEAVTGAWRTRPSAPYKPVRKTGLSGHGPVAAWAYPRSNAGGRPWATLTRSRSWSGCPPLGG